MNGEYSYDYYTTVIIRLVSMEPHCEAEMFCGTHPLTTLKSMSKSASV